MDYGAEDSGLVFITGQSQFDESKKELSYAMIACLNLGYHLSPLGEYKFPSKRFLGATALRRLKPKLNEFLVGMYQSIVIVDYQAGKFTQLMIYENVHSDIIDDIAIHENEVYSVTRKDKYVHQIKIINFY